MQPFERHLTQACPQVSTSCLADVCTGGKARETKPGRALRWSGRAFWSSLQLEGNIIPRGRRSCGRTAERSFPCWIGNPNIRLTRNIRGSTRVSLLNALVRDDDMEPLDDQIQASWPSRNSVSSARHACAGSGRNRNQTLVRAGRSSPTARHRYSLIHVPAGS